MSLELILGLVGGALVALFGGVGWRRIQKHGGAIERRKQAEEDRDDAIDLAKRRAGPMPGPNTRRRAALRRLRERGVRDD